MIKKRAIGIIHWMMILLFFMGIMIFQYHPIILIIEGMWFLLPFVTWFLNFRLKSRIKVKVELPSVSSKNSEFTGKLITINKSVIPVMKIVCKAAVENSLTGEKEVLYLPTYAIAKGSSVKIFQLSSSYCGYIRVRIEKIYLMDWLGFLSVKIQPNTNTYVSVVPDLFTSPVFLQMSYTMKEEGENWSPIKQGNDESEVLSLREYKEGDNIRQIHWKLSAKKGIAIVKEPSFPIEKALLIFWDKNICQSEPKEMDVLAECVSSLGREFIQQGITFDLGWSEGSEECFESIDSMDRLLEAIPAMLKQGFDKNQGTGEYLQEADYSKVIYFAGELPKHTENFFSCENITFIICNQRRQESMPNVISIRASNYMEDLRNIEI